MAGDSMQLQVVTPERTVMRGVTIQALVVPSVEGYLGVLPNHAPMVASLKPGVVRYKGQDGHHYLMAVAGGFLEVSENAVTLLVDRAEQAHEINISEAREFYNKMLGASVNKGDPNFDEEEALMNLEIARARLKAAEAHQEGGRRQTH